MSDASVLDLPPGQPMAVTLPGHLFAALPFHDVLETAETVIVDLHNRSDLVNVRGALQGGLVATLVDVAAGRLALATVGAGNAVTTADLSLHYLSAVVAGPARAAATIVRAGRRIVVVAVDIWDVAAGRLAARATVSFAVLTPRADQPATAP